VRGDNLSVDGSFVEANANKESRIPREQLAEAAQVKLTVRQYLVELEQRNPTLEPVQYRCWGDSAPTLLLPRAGNGPKLGPTRTTRSLLAGYRHNATSALSKVSLNTSVSSPDCMGRLHIREPQVHLLTVQKLSPGMVTTTC
jgi:hypothetical protein